MDASTCQHLHLHLPVEVIFSEIFTRLPPKHVQVFCKTKIYKPVFLAHYTTLLQDKFRLVDLENLWKKLRENDRSHLITACRLFRLGESWCQQRNWNKLYPEEIRQFLPYLSAEIRFYVACYAGLWKEVEWMAAHPQAYPFSKSMRSGLMMTGSQACPVSKSIPFHEYQDLYLSFKEAQEYLVSYCQNTPFKAAVLGGTLKIIQYFLRSPLLSTDTDSVRDILKDLIWDNYGHLGLKIILHEPCFATEIPYVINDIYGNISPCILDILIHHPCIHPEDFIKSVSLDPFQYHPHLLRSLLESRRVDPGLLPISCIITCFEHGMVDTFLNHPTLNRHQAASIICERFAKMHLDHSHPSLKSLIRFLLQAETIAPSAWIFSVPVDFWRENTTCVESLLAHPLFSVDLDINALAQTFASAKCWSVFNCLVDFDGFDPLWNRGENLCLAISDGHVPTIQKLLSHTHIAERWKIQCLTITSGEE
jgi:hypothetical protein